MKTIVAIALLTILAVANCECDLDKLKVQLEARGEKIRGDALAINKYVWGKFNMDSEERNVEFIKRILSLKKSDIIMVITFIAQRHPELCEEAKYNEVVGEVAANFLDTQVEFNASPTSSDSSPTSPDSSRPYGPKNSTLFGEVAANFLDTQVEFNGPYGPKKRTEIEKSTPLKEYLLNLPIETVKAYALAAEAYERNKTKSILLGGLHDYIDSLNIKQIVTILEEFIVRNPELTKKKLKNLVSAKNIEFNGPVKRTESELRAYLKNKELLTLKDYALAAEAYHREKHNIVLLGGLHDYIGRLDKNEIVETLIDFLRQNPGLTEEVLKGLVAQKTEQLTFVEDNTLNVDFLQGLEEEELKVIALALEKFDREKNGEGFLIGGIVNYFGQWNNNDLKKYINRKINKHNLNEREVKFIIYDYMEENKLL
jgi:hypothetical protein